MNRQTKSGLILAFLLGLLDIAILGALGEDANAQPPVGVVVASVMTGVATLLAVTSAWRSRARTTMRTVVALRVVSTVTSLAGIFSGDTTLALVSAISFVMTLADLALLRTYLPKPGTPKLGSV